MLIGHTLKGRNRRYRIYDRLHTGSTSTIYVGRDTYSGDMVVVKVFHPPLVNERFLANFERKIVPLQQIASPHIVRIYDWALREYDGVMSETLSYIVAEFVQGRTLADIIGTRGKLEEKPALAIARQLARALSEVHARGIIHHDVNSSHIMLTSANVAKLIDFGITKGVRPGTEAVWVWQASSCAYSPPEQLAEATSYVDHRADLYAMGVVLYEMLTGRLPVQEIESWAGVARIISGDLDPITGVSQRVEQLANAMLAPDMDERIGSADEVVRRIEDIIGSADATLLVERTPTVVGPKRFEQQEVEAPADAMPVEASEFDGALVTSDGREILLKKQETLIGRSHPRDMIVPDIDLEKLGVEHARTASRRHCRVFFEEGACFVEDLGSMNGTRVNDVLLEPGAAHCLTPGDTISVGRVELVFRVKAAQAHSQ